MDPSLAVQAVKSVYQRLGATCWVAAKRQKVVAEVPQAAVSEAAATKAAAVGMSGPAASATTLRTCCLVPL